MLFFLFLAHHIFCGYIEIELFSSSDCDGGSYFGSWISIVGRNSYLPIRKWRTYSVNIDGNQTFVDELYSGGTTDTFLVGQCYLESESYFNGLYSKYKVHDDLPFNREETKEWTQLQIYKDDSCEEPYEYSDLNTLDTNQTDRSGTEFLFKGDAGGLNTVLYSNESYLAIEYHIFTTGTNIEGYKFFNGLKDGECIEGYDRSGYTSLPSISKYSFNEAEFEEKVLIPKVESKKVFLSASLYWDGTCSGLSIMDIVRPQSYCHTSGNALIIADAERLVTVYYNRSGCTGEIYGVYSDYIRPNESCGTTGTGFGVIAKMVEDPNLNEGYGSIFMNEGCDSLDTQSVKEHIKNRDLPFDVYSFDFCLNDARSSFSIDWPPNTQSLRGKCSSGVVLLNNYTLSTTCDNIYEQRKLDFEKEEFFCVDNDVGGSHVFTCLPYFCDGISQYDFSSVCSGRGDCTGTDTCECDAGFKGKNCEYRDFSFLFQGKTIVIATSLFVVIGLCCIVGIVALCFLFIAVAILGSCTLFKQKSKIREFQKIVDDEEYYVLMEEKRLHEIHHSTTNGSINSSLRSSSLPQLRISKNFFQIDYKSLKLLQVLGEGGSDSVVYLVDWQGRKAAFKSFKSSDIASNQENFDVFEKEISILASVSFPNIVQFFGACLNPPRIGYLMEYCSGGDLVQFFSQKKGTVSFQKKMSISVDICSGMSYLHEKSIIHRDLKCNNVLMDEKETAKIMDFGLSRVFFDGISKYGDKTKRIGTSYYMAPEIYNGKDYDEKVDVFSFAIIFFCILSENFSPYGKDEVSRSHIEVKVAMSPYFRPNLKNLEEKDKSIPRWIINLIQICWSHDPIKRPSFKDIVRLFKRKEEQDEDENEEEKKKEEEEEEEMKKKKAKENFEQLSIMFYLKRKEDDISKAENFYFVEKSLKELNDIIRNKWKWGKEKWTGEMFLLDESGRLVKRLEKEEDMEEVKHNSLIEVCYDEISFLKEKISILQNKLKKE